jgi:plasmid replication initiation protein
MNKNEQSLYKNRALIHISGHGTLTQRKLYNILLSVAYRDLKEKDVFTVNLSKIIDLLGYEKKGVNYPRLQQDIIALIKIVVQWNIVGMKEEDYSWGATALLGSCEISKGVVEFSYSSSLRKKLIENKSYAKINLLVQNKFKSKFSLLLYELVADYYREKDNKGETPFIPVSELRTFFGLEKNEYSEFMIFNRDVIKKSVKEVSEKSDLQISVESKKDSKTITHLKFKILKSENSGFEEVSKSIPKNQELNFETSKITKDLLSFGVGKEKIADWSRDYSDEYIQSKLNLVLEKLKQGKIKTSPAGFLVKAIETNFEDKNISISDLLEQDALEARKINPETILVDPVSFGTKKDFEAHIEQLKGQYFEPKWLSSEYEIALENWNNVNHYN